jgi:hypothetical protein
MAGHIVLLGDSIFDNAVYVPGGPSVLEHARRIAPRDWKVPLVAVDGATVSSTFAQIDRIPADATHLVLSVGGNDALWAAGTVLGLASTDVRSSLTAIGEVGAEFGRQYRKLINQLCELRLPLTTCTVYDAVPVLGLSETAGLCLFNDAITRTAFEVGASLIDLRVVCQEASDYSEISPIEPSASGGGKIARAILGAVTGSESHRRVIV